MCLDMQLTVRASPHLVKWTRAAVPGSGTSLGAASRSQSASANSYLGYIGLCIHNMNCGGCREANMTWLNWLGQSLLLFGSFNVPLSDLMFIT